MRSEGRKRMAGGSRRTPILCAVVGVACSWACTEVNKGAVGNRNLGDPCRRISHCVAGLDCDNGTCVPIEPTLVGPQRGETCTQDAACGPEMHCSRQGVCSKRQPKAAGETCGLSIDCVEPLVCSGSEGICVAATEPNTTDLDQPCASLLECRRPYVCGVNNRCARLPLSLGPTCAKSETEQGAFRVYFELPPEDPESDSLFEFYRLPFPTDLRVDEGELSLAGHAKPSDGLGIDVQASILSPAEEDFRGFAPNQPVFFRFSHAVDPASLCLDPDGLYGPSCAGEEVAFCAGGGEATVFLVNIDPDAPQALYGERVPVEMVYCAEAGQVICHNHLGIAPLEGQPLRHATTYAAIVTTAVRDLHGDAVIPDRDFTAFLDGTASLPAMEVLLDYFDSAGVDRNAVAGAAVFTTADTDLCGPELRAAVAAAAPQPEFNNDVVVCGVDPGDSPCAQAEGRGCFGAHDDFYELQGTYANPVFQQGTRPFMTPAQGGAMVRDQTGQLVAQGSEQMCFALSVPKGTPPPQGYPVVIYAHGTGGKYRSFVDNGTAEQLAFLDYAVIGFDNVMHGPRQQPLGSPLAPETWRDPGTLFFNLGNPRAARDNVLQGAADLFLLAGLLSNAGNTLSGPDGQIGFDASRIYFMGHSQGTVISPAFLAADPRLEGAVLAGAGAELALSILNKKKPQDMRQVAGAFLGLRATRRVDAFLGLLSLIFAPADAVSYAHGWVIDPQARGGPVHLLHMLGVGDAYTPDVTQHALVRAAGIPLVGSVAETVSGVSEVPSPQTGNYGGTTTAGAVQLVPDGAYDGHFVNTKHEDGPAIIGNFFSSASADSTHVPQISKD